MFRLYWFLRNHETGASESVGSYDEVLQDRDRLVAKFREEGKTVEFMDRKRKVIVRKPDGELAAIFSIGRVDVPDRSVR